MRQAPPMLGPLPHPPLARTPQLMYLLERSLPPVVSRMGLVYVNDHCLTNVSLVSGLCPCCVCCAAKTCEACGFCLQSYLHVHACKQPRSPTYVNSKCHAFLDRELCVQVTWTLMSQLSRCHSSHMTKTRPSKSHMAEPWQGPLLHPHHILPP